MHYANSKEANHQLLSISAFLKLLNFHIFLICRLVHNFVNFIVFHSPYHFCKEFVALSHLILPHEKLRTIVKDANPEPEW